MAKGRRPTGEMSVVEAGRKGGRTTRTRHGREFYVAIGHRGGRATSDRYGHEFFVAIGAKGGARVRALTAAGRRAEAKARDV